MEPDRVHDVAGLDDAAIVAMALRDRNAYGLLVARYEPPLARYVRRILGLHAEAAEDVLQEAFVKAYVNLNDYDPGRPFAPWIYRIARNEALSLLRRKRAEPQAIGGEDGLALLSRMSDDTDKGASLAQESTQALVVAAMSGLGPRYRDVLVLRFLEDRSYGDIADILELPQGTVATLIRRGLQRMKSALEAAGLGIGSWDL
jgi:RNA polymerase sigma-70 factor (ECF subfamily)